MIITATEFKSNLGKYLEYVNEGDILITKNGKVIAQLSKPQFGKIAALRSLVGIASNDANISFEEIRNERLDKK